ncbi:hypothetical protein M0813_07476 [Anaeramoeba flamelloides]|uniref:HNH homing endonuclease n=1 Tax=Anaeramoeba flamelloides TaxID=1746091 RepID=A0ABQ8XB26_9EUKA|nr:hypothetical protein M0813_07476 [Anaeramoeba flamelloides]
MNKKKVVKRESFTQTVKRRLERIADSTCTNPTCRKSTTDFETGETIGIAAHIIGASSKGPRGDPKISKKELSSIQNGIWLCSNCATLIDKKSCIKTFTVQVLKQWKTGWEQEVKEQKQSKQKNKEKIQEKKTNQNLTRKRKSQSVIPRKVFEDELIKEMNKISNLCISKRKINFNFKKIAEINTVIGQYVLERESTLGRLFGNGVNKRKNTKLLYQVEDLTFEMANQTNENRRSLQIHNCLLHKLLSIWLGKKKREQKQQIMLNEEVSQYFRELEKKENLTTQLNKLHSSLLGNEKKKTQKQVPQETRSMVSKQRIKIGSLNPIVEQTTATPIPFQNSLFGKPSKFPHNLNNRQLFGRNHNFFHKKKHFF